MEFVINTKQRVVVSDNKITIIFYRKLYIEVYNDCTIELYFHNELIFKQKFSPKLFKSFTKKISDLMIAINCELLLTKYYEDVIHILNENINFIQEVFRNYGSKHL